MPKVMSTEAGVSSFWTNIFWLHRNSDRNCNFGSSGTVNYPYYGKMMRIFFSVQVYNCVGWGNTLTYHIIYVICQISTLSAKTFCAFATAVEIYTVIYSTIWQNNTWSHDNHQQRSWRGGTEMVRKIVWVHTIDIIPSENAMLEFRTICHARDLCTLARSC